MKKTILILLLSVSFLPFNLYAQSGRKTTEPKPDKTSNIKTNRDRRRHNRLIASRPKVKLSKATSFASILL